jgi:hypothetical protein
MRRPGRAQRLSVFSVLAVGSVGPDTLGTFTGPILRNPNC